VFLRRGLQKQFRFFLTYLLLEEAFFLSSVVANFVLANFPAYAAYAKHAYRWSMVSFQVIISVVSLGVIYELVSQLILSRSHLAKTLRPLLRWSAALLLLLGVTASAHLGITVQRAMNVFAVLDFSTSTLQVGLLAVLFLFSRFLRISWRTFSVGIALGLGVVGCAELSAAGLLSALSVQHYVSIDMMRLAAFHVCVLVWLGYLIFPKQEPKFTGAPMQASELEFWDQALQRMVRR